MHYVYVLKSDKDKKLYIGYTNDLRKKIQEHNAKKSISTESRAPFRLVYCEAYFSAKDAKERERKLKRFSGAYIHLKNRIDKSFQVRG